MGLKIEQECDWCGKREDVSLPRSGPLNLDKIGLPANWEEKPSFPGGAVGPQDGQQLCADCAKDYPVALTQGDEARDNTYRQYMQRARSRAGQGGQAVGAGKKLQSSSFGG